MSLRTSLYARTKHFIEKESLKEIIKRNKLDYKSFKNFPIELIETMETIKSYNHKATVLLDIGSHKGLFSKIANSFFDFDKTICFEPNKELHDIIRFNNKENKNLTVENIALSTQQGYTTFFLHQDSSMNSVVESENKVLKEEFPWDNPDLMRTVKVDTNTLDGYMSNNLRKEEVYFLKIDTQGNELNILKNGLSTLKQTDICIIEYMFARAYKSDFVFFDLINFMAQNKFECKGALSISKRPSKKISAVDFLFTKIIDLSGPNK